MAFGVRAGGGRSARTGLLCCIAASLLSGCVAEQPAELGVPVPARYDRTAARPQAIPARWWARFGSRELDNLIDEGDVGSLDLAAAVARVDQADAQVTINGSALFPTVDLSGDASRSRNSAGARPRNSVSAVANASYELDVWGRNRDILSAAQSDAAYARYAREVVRLTMQTSVAGAYLDLAAARGRLKIADDNVRTATRILDVVRQRLEAGTGTALDVAQQESFLASQRASIPPLRQTADQARTSLALLVGVPPQGFKVTVASLEGLRIPAVAPGLPSALLVRRPDVRQAEVNLQAAQFNVSAARKALLPAISLTGSGGYQSTRLATLVRPDSAVWSLAGGLTQPIFDGFRLQGEVDLAVGQRRELLETYRRSIVSGLTDVENALIDIRETAAQEAAQRVVVQKAREAFDLSEARLRQGTIDLVTLLNTQSTLSSAQDALVQTRRLRLRAAVSLYQALGGDTVLNLDPAMDVAAVAP